MLKYTIIWSWMKTPVGMSLRIGHKRYWCVARIHRLHLIKFAGDM